MISHEGKRTEDDEEDNERKKFTVYWISSSSRNGDGAQHVHKG